MIIKKATINTCVFTLSEKTTLTPVYYLFEFLNSQDNTTKYFLSADISNNKISYNEFLIEETVTENLLLGKVTLTLLGSWTYTIREQASSTNLDPALSGAIVEIGRIDVIEDSIVDTSFSSTSTIKVFNG